MKKNFLFRTVFVVVAAVGSVHDSPVTVLGAESYLGAEAVLNKLAEQAAAPADTDSAEKTAAARWRQDVKLLRARAAVLPPKDAAGGWLALMDRLYELTRSFTPEDVQGGEPPGFRDLLAALPPPAAWGELARAVDSRPPAQGAKAVREVCLRLVAHTLTADRAAQTNDLSAMEEWLKKAGRREGMFYGQMFREVSAAILETSGDTSAIMKSLETQLAQIENADDKQSLRVPDLVSLAGQEKAETFLRRALRTANVSLEISQGEETKRLARKLALSMIQELKAPQWQLACSIDAVELFEALEKRFGRKTGTRAEPDDILPTIPDLPPDIMRQSMFGNAKSQARMYYLLGLIVGQRAKEAAELAQNLSKEESVSLPYDALPALERAGYSQQLFDFFHELLSQKPNLPFWDEYVGLAAKAGQTDKMLALARAEARRDDLDPRQRAAIRSHLYKALLAADQVEEGVQEIREILRTNNPAGADPGRAQNPEQRGELGIELARLGELLGRTEWIDDGIAAARTASGGARGAGGFFRPRTPSVSLAELLVELSRGPEAESVLADALVQAARAEQTSESYGLDDSQRTLLIALARLYHQTGRPKDVLTLLDRAPQWGAKDLVDLYTEEAGGAVFELFRAGAGKANLSIGYIAAAALAATDRKSEARRVVDALLDKTGGFDPAYELLLQLGGDNILARLDGLFARDQFEERPLIWKAVVLQKAGKLEEAEKCARQAITIDPSDGEQGPGRRMRAYAVLADIREARGDRKEAEFLRGAVKAIRLSENADRFYEAGLLKRAVKMYQESLTYFADAYCIQSRLALRLADLGMHEAAEAHYRRAYELMPDSFGRVESHCFGCEHVFQGEKAQSLAEKVFSNLAIKTPNKPQVHYLLGYLREEQGRHRDALPHFRTAVKLDPDYLNAWSHLASISRSVRLPASERDAIALNLIRLDPLGRHEHAGVEEANDLRAIWTAVEAAVKLQPAKPATLYSLEASKAELEKKERDPKSRRELAQRLRYRVEQDEELSPAAAIARHRVIAALSQLLGNDYGAMLEE